MKLKMFLLGAGLTLATLPGMAQHTQDDSIHVRIMKIENGVVTDIDTTVPAAQHDQLVQYLATKGIELPPPPPPPPGMPGDSLHKMMMVIEVNDSMPQGENFRIAVPPTPPGAPQPPLPPGATIRRLPPPPPGHEGEVMVIVCDSTHQKKEIRQVVILDKKPGAVQQEKIAAPKEMTARELNVYPNPSGGRVTIDVNMPGKGKAELTITDMNGKTVYSEQLPETDGKITKEVDLSKNGKGMYSVRLSKNGKVIVEKVVIE